MSRNTPLHQSIQAAQETLYYINHVARSIHPSNGHAFLVQRASFFTGAPEHATPSKVRRVTPSATTTRAQAEAEQQHSEEDQFSSPQPNSEPSSSRPTRFAPGTGGPNDPYAPVVQDLYPQYDCYNVNILDPIYDTKAHVATCPPTNTCYCGRVCSNAASLRSHQERWHADGNYECISCDYSSDNMRHTWEHHHTQHLYIHTHMCKVSAVKGAKEEKFLVVMMNNTLSGLTCGMPTRSSLHFPAQSALLAVFLQRAAAETYPWL